MRGMLKKWAITGVLLCCNSTVYAAKELDRKLYFASWPDVYPPALLKKFEKETGIKTIFETYDSDAILTAKLKSGGGGYDVVVIGDSYVPLLVKDGLLMKLDKKKLHNIVNIKSEYRNPAFDPGRNHTLPYIIVFTGFAYDSASIPNGLVEESWESFFKPPEELRGKIANLNVEEELYMAASWYLGQDECSENTEDAKRVLSVLRAQKPYVATYNNNGTIERMVAKEVIMHQIWSGAAVRVQEHLNSVVFVYPKEGTRLLMDNLAIPTKAKNIKESYEFLNWMLKPENIAEVSNNSKYSNAIKGAEEFMDPNLAEVQHLISGELRDRFKPFKPCSPKAIRFRNKVWQELKSN